MASVIDMIIDLAKEAAKEPFSFDYQLNDELYKKISKAGNPKKRALLQSLLPGRLSCQ